MPRVLLTRRWLVRHAIVVFLLAAFGVCTWWQAVRAGQGNLRSYAYAIEWPIFGAFVIYVWWRTVRDELHPELAKRAPAQVAKRNGKAPRVGVSTNLEAIDDSDDPEVQAYNRYLASLNEDE